MSENFHRSLAHQLLAEALFYDEEYGAVGNVSLVDTEKRREVFVASFVPDEGLFFVEEATEWEDYEPSGDDEIDYVLAVDSRQHGAYETPGDAALVLLDLIEARKYVPSLTLVFEVEDSS